MKQLDINTYLEEARIGLSAEQYYSRHFDELAFVEENGSLMRGTERVIAEIRSAAVQGCLHEWIRNKEAVVSVMIPLPDVDIRSQEWPTVKEILSRQVVGKAGCVEPASLYVFRSSHRFDFSRGQLIAPLHITIGDQGTNMSRAVASYRCIFSVTEKFTVEDQDCFLELDLSECI